MTFENNPINRRMRALVDHARAIAFTDGPDDQKERMLAAATMLATAAVLAWPKGKKPPIPPDALVKGVAVAQYMWERRHWWFPAAGPANVVDLSKHDPTE